MASYFVNVFVFSSLSLSTVFSMDTDCGGGTCSVFTTEQKQAILDIHNELRDRVAGGGLSQHGHPAATNMNYLIWDDGLENVAQAYAESCPGLNHNGNAGVSYLAERNAYTVKWGTNTQETQYLANFCVGNTQDCIYVGENIAVSSGTYTINKLTSQIESGWFDEYQFWTYGNHNAGCQNGEMCGHYTQVVWANTRYVGCGYVNGCSGWSAQFICNYFPAGNFNTMPPYTQATTATSCTDCMSDRTVCNSNYVTRSTNAASYPSQPYNKLCDGGACPTMCDGGSYNENTCPGTNCDANNIDCDDGTINKNSGRNICSTNAPTSPTANPVTQTPTAPTTTTKAPTRAPVSGPVSCLILSDFQFSGSNGQWDYAGEYNNKPYYSKGGSYLHLNSYFSGSYGITSTYPLSNNPSISGYCDLQDLIDCSAGHWYYYCGDGQTWVWCADQAPQAAISPCPTAATTKTPSKAPTSKSPTPAPAANPTKNPTHAPTDNPIKNPTNNPSKRPSKSPTNDPTKNPSKNPTPAPTDNPTPAPTQNPTDNPTRSPTKNPTKRPTLNPSNSPTLKPSAPTQSPTAMSESPTKSPSNNPTLLPTHNPTPAPTNNPSPAPTTNPTQSPSDNPTRNPTKNPSKNPTQIPTDNPSSNPTKKPSNNPSSNPTQSPSTNPTTKPSKAPVTPGSPSTSPTISTNNPTPSPTHNPTNSPTHNPTTSPSYNPSKTPTTIPTGTPSSNPSKTPTPAPTTNPTPAPTHNPTRTPTNQPSSLPSNDPTPAPTTNPTDNPTPAPTINPTPAPTINPTRRPSEAPVTPGSPTKAPSNPTEQPTNQPSKSPTPAPTNNPTPNPTRSPTNIPTKTPTKNPTPSPTDNPTPAPTDNPTDNPTQSPSNNPSKRPSQAPITPGSPTKAPSDTTDNPTPSPTDNPTPSPTYNPTKSPTNNPSESPSDNPTPAPTNNPLAEGETAKPTQKPTHNPSNIPTNNPVITVINVPVPTATPTVTTSTTISNQCNAKWKLQIKIMLHFKFNPGSQGRKEILKTICESAFKFAIIKIAWNDKFCFELSFDHLAVTSGPGGRRRRQLLQTDASYEVNADFEYNNDLQNGVFNAFDKNEFAHNFKDELCSLAVSNGLMDVSEYSVSSSEAISIGDPIESVDATDDEDKGKTGIASVTFYIIIGVVCVGVLVLIIFFIYCRLRGRVQVKKDTLPSHIGQHIAITALPQTNTIMVDESSGEDDHVQMHKPQNTMEIADDIAQDLIKNVETGTDHRGEEQDVAEIFDI